MKRASPPKNQPSERSFSLRPPRGGSLYCLYSAYVLVQHTSSPWRFRELVQRWRLHRSSAFAIYMIRMWHAFKLFASAKTASYIWEFHGYCYHVQVLIMGISTAVLLLWPIIGSLRTWFKILLNTETPFTHTQLALMLRYWRSRHVTRDRVILHIIETIGRIYCKTHSRQ